MCRQDPSAGGESQTVGHRPSAQDVRAFPAGEASPAIGAAAHHSLTSTLLPENGFPFPSGKTRFLSSAHRPPHSNPGTSCSGRSKWTNEKAVGEGDSADVLLSRARGLRGQMLPPRSSGVT